MAWTAPKTWQADELLSAADYNTHLRDNLNALKNPPGAAIVRDNESVYTTTSTSWVSVDATNLKATITTTGGDVDLYFQGVLSADSASSRHVWFDFRVDGVGGWAVNQGFAGGIVRQAITSTIGMAFNMGARITGLPPGTHTFEVIWRQSGGTARLNSDSNDANPDIEQPLLLIAVER